MESQSLDMLCREIEKDTAAQIDSILTLAQKKAQEKIAKAQEEAKTIAAKILEEAKSKAEIMERKISSSINNETKKILLKLKEETIAEVKQKINERINNLRNNKQEYRQLLKNLTLESVALFEEANVAIVINQKDKNILDNKFMSEVKNHFKNRHKPLKLTIAQDTHEDLGIILKAVNKNVIWDNTLKKRIKIFEDEITALIIKKIFE